MILLDKREEAIENIQAAVYKGTYNVKVEPDDPVLTTEQRYELRDGFLAMRPAEGEPTRKYRRNNFVARKIVNFATRSVNRDSKIEGLEKAEGLDCAIVTSNHFSPIDNTVVRWMTWQTGRKRMPVVAYEENLAMGGLFGYLMNYADIIPLAHNADFMRDAFEPLLKRELEGGNFVLIYPEQEMWWNYRKPRPCKRGPYYYASRIGVPVLSCFVEIHDKEKLEEPNFVEVSYVMHVLGLIYPDPGKDERENSIIMAEQDYQLKKDAYEKAYGKELDYHFEIEDIAGWVPTDREKAVLPESELFLRCCQA